MPKFAAITENDISVWMDEPGVRYHFPKRYAKYLPTGTKVVYYKGGLQDKEYAKLRLSKRPHYFAFAEIGKVSADRRSTKGDLFATIENYQRLSRPVMAKSGESYLEPIPETRKSNYWRNGVRPISGATYSLIRSAAQLPAPEELNDLEQGRPASLESGVEGNPKARFVITYERNPALRAAAVAMHGVTCFVCDFNFGVAYGEAGEGYTHIHHVRPVSEFDGPTKVSPKNDLVPVCANCHAIIHRKRKKTIAWEDLRAIVKQLRRT